jgi:hypothetical protein
MLPLLAQGDAARCLRLSQRTLERLRVSGGGPKFVRAGARRILYRLEDIQTWLDDRVVGSTSEGDHRHWLTNPTSLPWLPTLWQVFCCQKHHDRYHYLKRKAEGEFEWRNEVRNELRRERKNGGPSTPEEQEEARKKMAAIIKELKAKSVQTIRRRI